MSDFVPTHTFTVPNMKYKKWIGGLQHNTVVIGNWMTPGFPRDSKLFLRFIDKIVVDDYFVDVLDMKCAAGPPDTISAGEAIAFLTIGPLNNCGPCLRRMDNSWEDAFYFDEKGRECKVILPKLAKALLVEHARDATIEKQRFAVGERMNGQ